ncbi:MAG: flagellar FlbD family protein [Candidatus Rifleibacteriota bacterium]
MIKLSRLNGKEFFLNAELIEQIESTPDTVITLISGKTVMVAESVKTVINKIFAYRRRIHGLRPFNRQKQKSPGS